MAAIQTDPQYKLRLPAELKDRIEAAAHANRRSMNAEIVARLESTLISRIGEPGFSASEHSPEDLRRQMLDLSQRLNSIADLLDKAADRAQKFEDEALQAAEQR